MRKHIRYFVVYTIKIIAIAIVGFGLWLIYMFNSSEFGKAFFNRYPYSAVCGILFLLVFGVLLFRLDDISRKILIGALWLFALPFIIFIVVQIVNIVSPPLDQISFWGNGYIDNSFLKSIIVNIMILAILPAISVLTIVFLSQKKIKGLFLAKTTQSKKFSKSPKKLKQILTPIYKTFLGGLVGFATCLGLGWVKMGVGFYLSFHHNIDYYSFLDIFMDTIYLIPISGILGVLNVLFVGGDFILIGVLFGGGIAFLANTGQFLTAYYSSDEVAAKAFRWLFFILAIGGAISIFLAINTMHHIRSTYASICEHLRSEDYTGASEYISPIFREEHPKGRGINRTKEFSSYCIDEKEKTLYVAPLGKNAAIFPEDSLATLIISYGQHPAIPMEKVDGRWYLTGEGAFKFDWFID